MLSSYFFNNYINLHLQNKQYQVIYHVSENQTSVINIAI